MRSFAEDSVIIRHLDAVVDLYFVAANSRPVETGLSGRSLFNTRVFASLVIKRCNT